VKTGPTSPAAAHNRASWSGILNARRSRLVVTALVAGALLTAGASGAVEKHPLTVASYPTFLLSFRYPTAWTRLDCEQMPTAFTSPVTFLTTATPTPSCTPSGWPKQRLGRDGLFVAWWSFAMPGMGWNNITKFAGRDAYVGGEHARVAVTTSRVLTPPPGGGSCLQVGAERAVTMTVGRPGMPGQWMRMTACLRGPDFGSEETTIQQLLATVRFAKP
jgi:hypothetical protein